jgi:hypothetical protein
MYLLATIWRVINKRDLCPNDERDIHIASATKLEH